MKVRKTIKKIAALGVGLSMLGTTVLGAMAADLGDYPAPLFIQNGEFNGVIVLGDNAISSDTLGAIDIATSLQYGGGSTETSISNGVKIEASGNDLNINESMADIDTTLDDADLPVILGDGTFEESDGNNKNEEDYTQELKFYDGTGELQLDQDKTDAPNGGLYLVIDKNEVLYNYTLEFEDYLEYDNTSATTASDDMETAKIEIQGNLYTITDVKLDTGKIKSLTLQAGDTTVWLEQGAPITRIIGGEEHEVELMDVNEDENKCGVTVDGTLMWVDTGSSKKVSGIEIGVTDAIVVHSELKDTDVCEVNLGASEIKLENNQEIELNGKDIDGSKAFYIEALGGKLEEIKIQYTPDEKMYLAAGDTYADPVLGNFEISYAGVTVETSDISLDVSSNDFALSFNNVDGKEVELPFYCNNSCDAATDVMFFGTDNSPDERYYFDGGICVGTSDVNDCEGARFLVEEGKELHVIEIDDIDTSNNRTTLKDITYGSSKTTSNSITNAAVAHDLPAGGQTVNLAINTATNAVSFIDAGTDNLVGVNDAFFTEYEAQLNLTGFDVNGSVASVLGNLTPSNFTVTFVEPDNAVDSTSGTEDSRSETTFMIDIDTSDEEFDVNAPGMVRATFNNVDVSKSNDDDQLYYSNFGTSVVYDSKEARSAEIVFPEEELFASVFVSPVGANVVVSGSGASKKIEVGTAKLASEVASLEAQNSLIIGGPCANAAAAEFLGVTSATCSEGAPEVNTAVIKLQAYGENVAMLVNGYDAIDTRRAARVLANYADYSVELTGDEVVVSGTDFSNIVVTSAAE